MLQFWRKAGQKESGRSNTVFEINEQNVASTSNDYESYKDFESPSKSKLLPSLDDEGLFDIGDVESTKEHSRLSKTLQEVLSDKSALEYFVQYLKSRNACSYVRCWLDIDNFQGMVQQTTDESKINPCSSPSFKIEHDSLSVSTDCDSITADSNSLYDFAVTNSEEKTNGFCDNSDSGFRNFKNARSRQNIVDFALKIFKKYVAIESVDNVRCCDDVRKEIIENICNSERIVGSCFEKVQNHVVEVMDKEYFSAFLSSDFFCKHQIDVLTSGNVVLDDILYNETALFYFMEFLEQENCKNLLEFWLTASNFQQQLHDQREFFDPLEAQNDAVVLYDKYFSLQALCPLGFSDKVRFAVEQNICGENGLMIDCFHLPLKIVEQVLEKNYLRPFLASQLFYKYLSELISSVQSSGYTSVYERDKSSPSDCGSERSFSVNSTFLAMENPNNKKKKGADMNIDTRQLYDPDSLWKRRKSTKLTFGRITSLGKYETDFEPEPDKKTPSILKNVVRKFVNLEEDKKKEELAWQVAEMIVKDITSVTMNQNH